MAARAQFRCAVLDRGRPIIQTILQTIERSRLESLLQRLEVMREQNAVSRDDLAELVAACREMPLQMQRLNDSIVRRVVEDDDQEALLVNFNEYGSQFRDQFLREIELVKEVRKLAINLDSKDIAFGVDGILMKVIADLEQLYHQTVDPWPFFTKESHDEALAEVGRGEFVPIEEWTR